MDESQIPFMSTVELARAIRSGKTTSRRALDVLVERNKRVGGPLNVIVLQDIERARERADMCDAAAARGEFLGPLHGVPITVKEWNAVAGMQLTRGDPARVGQVSQRSEVMIQKIMAAGVIIWGKSNMPLNAADVQTYNKVYGTTSNPWDFNRTPGGSSGGAAAVAVGITPLELASDLGGSIRTPAAFCGIYGHKPTYGLIPRCGPNWPKKPKDIAVLGLLARAPEDLSLTLNCVAGPDGLTVGESWRLELPRPVKSRLAEYRVAIWADDHTCRVHDDIVDRAEALTKAFESAGATVDRTARPDFDFTDILPTWITLTAFNDHVKLSQYKAAQEKQGDIRDAWAQFFTNFDIVICPSNCTPAFLEDESEDYSACMLSVLVDGEEKRVPCLQQLFWAALTNVAQLPSTTFPCGLGLHSGLPVGLNVVGPEWSDLVTIDFARLISVECGFGFHWPPKFAPPFSHSRL